MTRASLTVSGPSQQPERGLAQDMAKLLSLEIPADCRTGLLANFELLRAHGQKLEAGIQAARLRSFKRSRSK